MKKLINILINFGIFILLNYEISGSETLQITTYYPAPYGGYTRLLKLIPHYLQEIVVM